MRSPAGGLSVRAHGLRSRRGAAPCFGLTLRQRRRRSSCDVDPLGADVALPVGRDHASQTQTKVNPADSAGDAGGSLIFEERGTPPVAHAEPHNWAAAVGSARGPKRARTGAHIRGPQGPPLSAPSPGRTPPRRRALRRHRLRQGQRRRAALQIKLRARGRADRVVRVAGSETGAAARARARPHARRPARALRARSPSARRWRAARGSTSRRPAARSRHRLEQAEPGRLRAGGARPRAARDQRRQALPAAEGTLARARFLGAGFPDYPWLFATDGEYTAFASVALGQFEPIKEHLRALASRSVNNGTAARSCTR